MSVSVATRVLQIGTGAAGTNYTISGLSFAPKAIICWVNGSTSATDTLVANLDMRLGVGFATSPTDRCCSVCQADENNTTTATDRVSYDDAVIADLSITGTDAGKLDIASFDSGGVTFVVDTQFAAVQQMLVWLIGGSDITNAKTVAEAMNGATGDHDYTNVGFQGNMLFLATVGATTFGTAVGAANFGFGAAVSSSQQATISVNTQDNQANTNTARYSLDTVECLGLSNGGAGVTSRFSFTSWLSNGFRLNRLESTNTTLLTGLVIQGGSWAIKPATTQTDTVTDIVITGCGFAPKGGMVFGHLTTENTQDTAVDHAALSVGAFDSTSSRAALLVTSTDNAAVDDTVLAIEYDEIYINEDPSSAGGALVGLMDIKSLDSDGVTYIMDAADSSGTFTWSILVGDTPAGSAIAVKSAYYNQMMRNSDG